ncbi:FecCD family ABC transporter permease [Radiobacillus deserti]|uniref:Iron ABC transporter permease n=1 Tax=Radiobacillus deserti TaxID=2594883 RepID=A0A516KC62_9BACI|nr:iron ABC transporter permease [Radiobacillus deserti]QDP38972.1 iron ABC transporter permease [Radiobacillus deserti]
MLNNNLRRTIGLALGILVVVLLMWASVILGLTDIHSKMVIDAYTQFDGSNEHIIIKDTRVPRALIAAAVGASLAITGTIMQGLTKNPLASPSILGVNAGASFFVVFGLGFLGATASTTTIASLAFSGAAVATIMVYLLGSMGRDGLTPVKLTLAGAAIGALFSSMTQGILSLNEQALDQALFWLAGSVQGRDLHLLVAALPFLVIGWVLSLLLGKHMNVFAMGEDLAKSLGQKTWMVKSVGGIIIVLLAGGSVSISGPIGFIGIVIPHISKWFVGIDFRWVIPFSGLLGAILLLVADIGARYIIMPAEVPVGVMTAFIGVPFFIFIARRGIQQ